MKRKIRRAGMVLAGVLSVTLLTGGSLWAQTLPPDWAKKLFTEHKHDFGVVARGSEVRHRFLLKNIYSFPVHITSVRTTCGCTGATASKYTIQPGETAYIEAKMDTVRFFHEKSSNVIVTFDSPAYAQVYLPVHVYIRRDVVFTPGSANFGIVQQGQQAQKVIHVAYAGRHDWKILDVKSGSPHVEAQFKELKREGMYVDYELTVTLKPTAPPGEFRTLVTLITDDQNGRDVPLVVEAVIQSEYTVTPEVVSLGLMQPGEQRIVNVVIKGRQPFEIEKMTCSSGCAHFKAKLPQTAKAVQVIPISVTAPKTPGTIDETFTVRVKANGKTAELHFKVYGKVGG